MREEQVLWPATDSTNLTALVRRGDLSTTLPDGTSCEALALEGLARRCKEALKGGFDPSTPGV